MTVTSLLTAWALVSALLGLMLGRDYRRGHVTRPTECLLWVWHALNYALLAAFAVRELWPLGLGEGIRLIGWIGLGLGLAVIAAGFYEFRSAKRLTGARQDEVIESGVYRFSRHPQYLGIMLTLVGGALAGDSGAALILAVVLCVVFLAYLPIEERYARNGLGAAYERYRQRTPLLIGKPR